MIHDQNFTHQAFSTSFPTPTPLRTNLLTLLVSSDVPLTNTTTPPYLISYYPLSLYPLPSHFLQSHLQAYLQVDISISLEELIQDVLPLIISHTDVAESHQVSLESMRMITNVHINVILLETGQDGGSISGGEGVLEIWRRR